jgi:predicted RecA/RadA family phage recombinase
MPLEAAIRYGSTNVVDYTPVSAVAAGEVVVVGELNMIAHTPIPANTLGALACGGGIYKAQAAGAITAGAKVYWDNAANRVTTTVGSNKVLGWLCPYSSAAAAGDFVEFIHDPGA